MLARTPSFIAMNAIREQFERIKADKFLLTWNIVNLFVILGPLIVFGVARRGAENYNYGNNNNNNNNNYQENWNGQNEYRYDQYGNFLGQKHWWQFWKRNNHYNQNGVSYYQEQNQGGQQENGFGAPWWCKCCGCYPLVFILCASKLIHRSFVYVLVFSLFFRSLLDR